MKFVDDDDDDDDVTSGNLAVAGGNSLVFRAGADTGKYLLKVVVIKRILAPIRLHPMRVELLEPRRPVTQNVINTRRVLEAADPDATVK